VMIHVIHVMKGGGFRWSKGFHVRRQQNREDRAQEFVIVSHMHYYYYECDVCDVITVSVMSVM